MAGHELATIGINWTKNEIPNSSVFLKSAPIYGRTLRPIRLQIRPGYDLRRPSVREKSQHWALSITTSILLACIYLLTIFKAFLKLQCFNIVTKHERHETSWISMDLELKSTSGPLTLSILWLLLPKAQGCKYFFKSSKPCHVGTHWKALAEHFQISTHLPRVSMVFQDFCIILYWPIKTLAA